MSREAIMTSILSSLTEEGSLPRGYRLPAEGEVAPEMQFLDGAEDGVRLYHMKARELDLAPYTTALYDIRSGSERKALRALKKAIAEDKKRFIHMIDVVGPLQKWMHAHPNVMQDEHFLRFALSVLVSTDDKEIIKFALAIISNYGIDEKGQIAKMIRLLALSDEFTFQCVVMMKDWENGSEEVFEVAKRVYGWGKIHAVHYLEPDTAQIRHWMLAEGCRNDVRNAYLARDLATRLPLVKILTDKNIDDAEFDGISVIMEGLFDESMVPGISSLKDRDILMNVYLKQADGRILSREGVNAVSKIRAYQGK